MVKVSRHLRHRSVLPWRELEYLVIDLETSGLDLERDEILSYGMVTVRAGRIIAGSSEYALVRPHRPVPPASTMVHSLRTADLIAGQTLETAVRAIGAAAEGRILVAHAAWIEQAFLRRAFKVIGRRFRPTFLDTAALARTLGWTDRSREHEPSLEWLCRSHGVPVHTPHEALGDALTTAGLFLVEAATLDGQRPGTLTLRDLAKFSRN